MNRAFCLWMARGLRGLAVLVAASIAATGQHGANREEPARDPRLARGQIAPILDGLGDHHHPITTANPESQKFFDQGLRLAYGFNHREADRAFQEAIRLDPECAMGFWGRAFANGPNLNMPMEEEGGKIAYEAIQQALLLKDETTEAEQDYIEALAKRFAADPKAERAPLDRAYAEAMAELAKKYPNDDDALVLYGDALMNLSPWYYWTADNQPREHTGDFLAAFETVIARNPKHAGAHHYYIHACEAAYPERALESADALAPLMPGAGHMVHMPSHIYIRVGDYERAIASNQAAIGADEQYITQCNAQGIYPLGYYPHNIHFLWAAATYAGRSQMAIEAAKKVQEKIPPEALGGTPSFETFYVTPYFALTRFGKWDEILALPEPAEKLAYTRGMWHYARGMALTRKHDFTNAEKELGALRDVAASELGPLVMLQSAPSLVLDVAAECLAGELALERGDYEKAIAHLERGVRLQDGMRYNEPPDWHYPVRQSLGAALLAMNRPEEAATVYWEDLRRNPETGWSLFGLLQAYEAQKNDAMAAEVKQRFERAWANADIELRGSRF